MSAACPLFGFDVVLVPAAGADEAALHAEFLKRAVDHDGLTVRPGTPLRGRFTLTRDGDQVTDADRQAIAAWAAGQPAIASVELGPLVDLSPSA